MSPILNYLLYLLTGIGMVAVFFVIYTTITSYDEVLIIRQGNEAAALALGGTLIGFSLPIASAMMHTKNYSEFLVWAGIAMVIQVLVFGVVTRLLKNAKEQMEANNRAFGGLLGAISVSIGLINAGGIS
ncbi:MAG: DUF350 domain-containing protein [Pseudomonadota bacterium]